MDGVEDDKTQRTYDPSAALLLPASRQEWLPADYLRMMVKVLLSGYCIGISSSRRIACHLQEDIVFGVLVAANTPDFHTLSVFCNLHLTQLSDLFRQVQAPCQREGLAKLGHSAKVSTELKANASNPQAMSHKRMKEKKAQLKDDLDTALQQAQEADAAKCRQHDPTRRRDEWPEELSFREG